MADKGGQWYLPRARGQRELKTITIILKRVISQREGREDKKTVVTITDCVCSRAREGRGFDTLSQSVSFTRPCPPRWGCPEQPQECLHERGGQRLDEGVEVQAHGVRRVRGRVSAASRGPLSSPSGAAADAARWVVRRRPVASGASLRPGQSHSAGT